MWAETNTQLLSEARKSKYKTYSVTSDLNEHATRRPALTSLFGRIVTIEAMARAFIRSSGIVLLDELARSLRDDQVVS